MECGVYPPFKRAILASRKWALLALPSFPSPLLYVPSLGVTGLSQPVPSRRQILSVFSAEHCTGTENAPSPPPPPPHPPLVLTRGYLALFAPSGFWTYYDDPAAQLCIPVWPSRHDFLSLSTRRAFSLLTNIPAYFRSPAGESAAAILDSGLDVLHVTALLFCPSGSVNYPFYNTFARFSSITLQRPVRCFFFRVFRCRFSGKHIPFLQTFFVLVSTYRLIASLVDETHSLPFAGFTLVAIGFFFFALSTLPPRTASLLCLQNVEF